MPSTSYLKTEDSVFKLSFRCVPQLRQSDVGANIMIACGPVREAVNTDRIQGTTV
ncbi:MAG: hypothetical protein ABF904_14995 [Ethanoligenens sp.]